MWLSRLLAPKTSMVRPEPLLLCSASELSKFRLACMEESALSEMMSPCLTRWRPFKISIRCSLLRCTERESTRWSSCSISSTHSEATNSLMWQLDSRVRSEKNFMFHSREALSQARLSLTDSASNPAPPCFTSSSIEWASSIPTFSKSAWESISWLKISSREPAFSAQDTKRKTVLSGFSQL